MVRTARDRAVNRKLKAVTKGRQLTLDRVQVPTHEWYHSRKGKELYRYDQGNFEAYPAMHGVQGKYLPNHVTKVLPKDALMAEVQANDNGG